MLTKMMESKRGVLFVFSLLLLSLLLILSWVIGAPRVEAGIQSTIAGALRDVMTFGLPVLIGSITATDWREAPAAMVPKTVVTTTEVGPA